PDVRGADAHRLPMRQAAGRLLRVSTDADRRRRGVRTPAGRGGRAHRARLGLRHAGPHPHLAHRRARDRGTRAAGLRARIPEGPRRALMPDGQGTATVEPADSVVRLTHVIYALHAVSLVTGIVTAATVVFAFLTGWPSIIAVILNYVKRREARGTWL